MFVSPDKWDSKAQRVKGASSQVLHTNTQLESIRLQLTEIYTLGRAKGKLLSPQEISDMYRGVREMSCTFKQLCEKKIEHFRLLKRSPRTIEIHERAHRFLSRYLKENLPAEAIEKRHISGFWAWLKNKGYDHDYVNKTVANCKSLFKFGEEQGYVDDNPFKSVSFTWEDKLDLTSLEDWEMDKLKEIEWSGKLQKVVDSFLFMCYTGLHISDYQKLAPANLSVELEAEWITISRTKTKVQSDILITPEAKAIIQKYGDVKSMPKISGQKSNDYLKVIAERIGTSKNLTNKVARKTFTDRCLNDHNFSEESVANMLGHKSTAYVRKYGEIKKKRILSEWKKKFA